MECVGSLLETDASRKYLSFSLKIIIYFVAFNNFQLTVQEVRLVKNYFSAAYLIDFKQESILHNKKSPARGSFCVC